MGERFDVLAVSLRPGEDYRMRVLDRNLTRDNADAFVKFAVVRLGVGEEFYVVEPTGRYRDGDRRTSAARSASEERTPEGQP